jgi:outer membrane receptor protein involved in Fe transport
VRFASKRLGAVEFLVGGFYTFEDAFFKTDYPIINPDGSRPTQFMGNLLISPNPATYKEYAGFGNLTVYLSDDFDVTGGFRYSRNEQFIDSKTFGFFTLFFPNAIYQFKDTAKNYLATARWRPTESINFYARAASGYRPGGPNIGAPQFAPFISDTTWNYEVGVKGSLANRTINYSLAVYHIDWSDVQLPGQDPVSTSQITTNGGGADIDGIELELSARPVRPLSLSAALGYNRTKLTSVRPDVTAVIGAVAGDRFPLSPRWTGSLVGDYLVPLGSSTELALGLTLRYLSDRNSNFPGSPLNVRLPGYTTMDARANVKVNDRFSVTARVENLTNKRGVGSYSTTRLFPDQPGVFSNAYRIRPRTFTLSVAAEF